MALKSINLMRCIKTNNMFFRMMRLSSYPTSEPNKKYLHEENSLKSINCSSIEDADTFGMLSKHNVLSEKLMDENDQKEETYLQNSFSNPKKLTTKQYADLIKEYVKHKRLKEAIDVLQVKMLSEDQVKPENYIYNILIGACADVGFTKMAFKLYNDMKRRALKVTGDTYTCLFNCCANSPWPDDGLKNAKHLKKLMTENNVEPNLTNYNAMIKAFGRCGDLSTAFKIVDEMLSKNIKIRVHTFNFLLQACISDKNNGLRHAIVVWRKMISMKEKPNIFSFNLILKCVKECNIGSKEDMEYLLKCIEDTTASQGYLKPLSKSQELKLLNLNTNEIVTKVENTVTQVVKSIESAHSSITPNLLSRVPQLSTVLSLQEAHSSTDRFAIVGGADGFLKEMHLWNTKPDIKTFTQILSLTDDSTEAENKLIETMNALNIKADIAFYNMLIKKRCLRSDYKEALMVKDIIYKESKFRKNRYYYNKKLQLKFNIMTYGVLAMTCKDKTDAEKLLGEMQEAGLKTNMEILGTLLRQGTANCDFGYVLFIMNFAKTEKLKINSIFIDHLKAFNEKCEQIVTEDDQGMRKCSNIFLNTYKIYKNAYKRWLNEIDIEEALKPEHPWKQFMENEKETVQRQNLIKQPRKFIKRKFKFITPYVPRIK